MTTVTYSVPAMHCGHCTHTLETEVGELQGVQAVKADLSTKKSKFASKRLPAKKRSRHYSPRSIILSKD